MDGHRVKHLPVIAIDASEGGRNGDVPRTVDGRLQYVDRILLTLQCRVSTTAARRRLCKTDNISVTN